MLENHRKRKRNGADQSAGVDLSTRFGPGGRDAQEYGRRGGQKSAEIRAALARLDPDVIAAKLARSPDSPLALRAALDFAVKRETAVDRQRRLADQTVVELMDEEDRLREQADQERERIAALRQECRELEDREAELRRRLESDDGIVAVLEQIGERRATAAAERLGWGDDGEDDGDVAA
jgi:hypothetical protein